GYGNGDDRVIAKGDHKGDHDHGKGDTFLRHSEGSAAQREKDEEQRQSQTLQTLCLLDKCVDTCVDGAGLHDDAESAAYYQDQGTDANCGPGTVAGHQTFKYIVQETEASEILCSPDAGGLVQLFAGIVKLFAVQGIHLIVA